MEDYKNIFFGRITDATEKLTPAESVIAEHLMHHYPHCMLKTASELSTEIDVNISTVTRFFQKIGYKSIKSAQKEFKDDMELKVNSALAQSEHEQHETKINSELWGYAINDITNIEATFKKISHEKIDILINLLSNRSNQVFIGSCRNPGYSSAWYLFSCLLPIHPAVVMLEVDPIRLASQLATVAEGDLLLLFDFRKAEKLNQRLVEIFHRQGGHITLFTDNILSPLVETVDLFFEIKTVGTSRLDSHVAVISLLNTILGMLSRNWEDYHLQRRRMQQKIYKELE